MNEVSCRALEPFFTAVSRRNIPRERLLVNINRSLAHLQNRHEHIDWDEFREYMANVRRIFDEQQLREIGAVGLKEGAGFRSFALIGRTLFSASGFYRWMLTSGGMGNQLFSNMTPSFRELAPGRIDLDLQVAPGYEPCPDFFHFAAGGFQALPALVGLKEAAVTMVWIERGARFQIAFEAKDSRRARVLRRLTRGSDARATAKELNDAIKVLERRNALLHLSYQLGNEVWGLRELKAIGDRVVSGIVGHVNAVGARLSLVQDSTVCTHGAVHGLPTVSIPLPGTPSPGHLEVWTTDSNEDVRRLADLIAPTIGLALDNAIAYHELAEYKTGLEKLVDQRTAELRVARDALAGTVEQLKDAQEAREKFFGNISHEIRTPLSLIMLSAGDVERRLGHLLDERGRNGLVAVTDSARKLLRLVDELLLLAAGQADKLTLSIETTNVSALFEQLVATWRPAAESASLAIEARVPPTLIANVDPVAIERIASNLMSNAIKYTPAGGRVELEVVVDAEHVRLSVLDTGPGIDADLANRLFGRFERAAGADRRKAGTGIGLALVKQLAEAHGGTVAALPRPSGGTEMRVLLPASVVTREDRPLPPTFLRTTHAPAGIATIESGDVLVPAGLSMGTIVIAEDEPRLAESIARLLSDEYTVVVALDGNAALAMVEQHQPQLLITDVDMPGMTGIELARRFREVTGDRLAPIIILSAVLDLRTRLAGLEAGAVDYVGKPFDPAELRARVHAQFRMRDMAMRLHRAEQLSAMGILTSGLAHELRNPANGIINALAPLTELLPDELIGPETGPGQLIDVMKSCAEQIGFLTRQLLGFRSNSMLELRSASLPQLVQRAVKLAHRALVGVDVRTNVDAEAPVLCAAPLLVQVLANLIENAGHAAGPEGWVELTATTSGTRVTVEVTDSGSGIPPELRERVFEPFFTTKAPGVGTGLGLPLARTIIHKHGGVLEIRERAGRMAFVIELNVQSNLAESASAV